MSRRWAAWAVAGLRIAYGLGLIVAPRTVGAGWIEGSSSDPGAQVAMRSLGARDVALGGVLACAAAREEWVVTVSAAVAVCDLADVGSTLAAGDALPRRRRALVSAVAGGAAAGALAVAAAWRSR